MKSRCFCVIYATADLCDFEEGDCNWTQQADDDFDWVRGSGATPAAHTGPSTDHSTNTDTGHYYYLESTNQMPASKARMASPAFPSGKSSPGCFLCGVNLSERRGTKKPLRNIWQK